MRIHNISVINYFLHISKYDWTKYKMTISVSIECWTALWQFWNFINFYSAREPAVSQGNFHSLFMICTLNGYMMPWVPHPWRVFMTCRIFFPSACVASCCCENAVLQLCIRRTSGSSADLKARRAAKQINRSSSLWTQTPEVPLTMNTSQAVLRWRHRSKKQNKQKNKVYVVYC